MNRRNYPLFLASVATLAYVLLALAISVVLFGYSLARFNGTPLKWDQDIWVWIDSLSDLFLSELGLTLLIVLLITCLSLYLVALIIMAVLPNWRKFNVRLH